MRKHHSRDFDLPPDVEVIPDSVIHAIVEEIGRLPDLVSPPSVNHILPEPQKPYDFTVPNVWGVPGESWRTDGEPVFRAW